MLCWRTQDTGAGQEPTAVCGKSVICESHEGQSSSVVIQRRNQQLFTKLSIQNPKCINSGSKGWGGIMLLKTKGVGKAQSTPLMQNNLKSISICFAGSCNGLHSKWPRFVTALSLENSK